MMAEIKELEKLKILQTAKIIVARVKPIRINIL